MLTPEILFEDNEIIVCYKPAGLAVQTRRLGQQDMETWFKNYRARKKEKPYIGIIHRLDQPVEGVMVFAKTPKSAAALSAQVQNRDIGKYYYAVGCGASFGKAEAAEKEEAGAKPEAGEKSETVKKDKVGVKSESVRRPLAGQGTLTDHLTFDQRANLGKVSDAKDPQAKKAVLDYKVLGEKPAAEGSLLCFAVHLHTGRHHQIRLQLSNAGYPLVGDIKYGGKQAPQLALCSYRISFKHPVTGKQMDFQVKPRNDVFRELL